MIDPGHPFSVPYEELIERLEEHVRRGVERPDQVRWTYRKEVTSYELPRPAEAVRRVSGTTGAGLPRVFEAGDDYLLRNNRILWQDGGAAPEPGSRFTVEYTYREEPSGLTDFNPGSVVGTLVRAVAREMKVLHEQVDQAYRRAFIDQASGVALDNVVALVGVERKKALPARGEVTFRRQSGNTTDVVLATGIRVEDESGRAYVTTADAVLAAADPDVKVPVEALEPGPRGNVNAGAIVIMPTPPPGVEGVENEAPVEGGRNAEGDDELRERARHALERSGNATLDALRFAVLGVEGVEGVEVADHSVDDTIPPGEVRVRYTGGDPAAVEAVVEETRAAGVMARIETLVRVAVSGTFYLFGDTGAEAGAAARFAAEAAAAIDALDIGQPLSLRRLGALAYQVPGLADVAEAQLRYRKELAGGESEEGDVGDPLLVARTELVRADAGALDARLLTTLAGQRRTGTALELELWLEDATGGRVRFRALALDVAVVLRAVDRSRPEQPPERVGSFTTRLTWAGAELAVLAIDPAQHAPDFRSDDHEAVVAVEVHAAAYPALGPATELDVELPS